MVRSSGFGFRVQHSRADGQCRSRARHWTTRSPARHDQPGHGQDPGSSSSFSRFSFDFLLSFPDVVSKHKILTMKVNIYVICIVSLSLIGSIQPFQPTFIKDLTKDTFWRRNSRWNTFRYPPITTLYAGKDSSDLDFDIDEDDDDEKIYNEEEYFPLADIGATGLGINIADAMGPMTPEEIADLKAEATEIIDKAFDSRLQELEKLKTRMDREIEKDKKMKDFESEQNAVRETEKLMSKIDRISENFLKENEALRMSTKAAARADKNMGGKGLDVGSWGEDASGNEVTTGFRLGAMNAAAAASARNSKSTGISFNNDDFGMENTSVEVNSPSGNKILVMVDSSQKMDLKLLETFTKMIQESVGEDSSIEIEECPFSKPAPIGGLNAQTAILFTSSLSDRSSMDSALDRIMRRTAPVSGKLSSPPSHLVCISVLGTERTDKMPYSMQNLLGRKLDKKRSIEECVMSKIKRRDRSLIPCDYTVLKFGNILDKNPKDVEATILPGDSLDGDIGIDAAATILMQAVAYQPNARNATISATGFTTESISQEEWNDLFLRLDGPELFRFDIPLVSNSEETVSYKYERLSEYMEEWAETIFVKTAKTGLTTPVTVEIPRQVKRGQSSVQILFKQTNTGKYYKSASEEREMEKQTTAGSSSKASTSPPKKIPMAQQKKEGGVEVLVEMQKALPKDGTDDGYILRVRAKRCNMDDDVVIKEISEGTILKKLKESVDFWVKQQEI